MSDTTFQYRLPARVLHWTVAVLVLATIPAGLTMVQPGLPRPLQDTLFVFHKNVGLLIPALVLLRAWYRWRHPPGPLPADLPVWQRTAAGVSHRALYGLLVLMPIAGYVRVKAGGFPLESLDWLGIPSLVPRSEGLAAVAKTLHYLGAIAIIGLIALHVAAAAYHGLVRRDTVFWRMWPPFTDRAG